jgi:hypothetical protein
VSAKTQDSLTEESAIAAVDFLRDKARMMAQARAERIYCEEWLKALKSTLVMRSTEKTVARAEAEAYASVEYKEALQAYRDAVERDEHYRWLAKAAEARYEAWRTLEATRRVEHKL